jgi:hypothetical protein
MPSDQNRRNFLGAAAGAAAFTIVPRHVLGAPFVAPSDKITLAYIGVGTQGLREMMALLQAPEIQIVSVCDPSKYAVEYRDWDAKSLLNSIRRTIGKPDWNAGKEGAIPGGRDAARNIVDTYYSTQRSGETFKGCSAYVDYRELLDKERDLNAVKVMTPDHLHAPICLAAMKKGKHTIVHKPLANRLTEAKAVVETARKTGVATHFLPWDANGNMEPVMAWIRDGAIGTLREVHNCTNRPVWPQYATMPGEAPPVPEGFDWNMWLGPVPDRPYSPNYTHMVFRGWYDFGGGSMADMGHYSLWTVFNALGLSGPTSIEPMVSHNCMIRDNVSTTIRNDFSFPTAGVVRFKFPAKGQRAPVDLIWYEGGMRPPTPPELEEDNQDIPAEAMMFVGDKGKILAGFHVDRPRLIPARRMQGMEAPPAPARRGAGERPSLSAGMQQWIQACKGGKQSPGNFTNAWPISEAANLYAVAMRTGKKLVYDAASMKITNLPDANKYLTREYRKGWELESA